MELIYANRPGEPCTAYRTLTSAEREALLAHYQGDTEQTDQKLAQSVLASAYQARQWFACSCRPSSAPALLYAARGPGAEYRLLRMTDRPPHQRSCPFVREPPEGSSDTVSTLLPLGQLLMRWVGAAR